MLEEPHTASNRLKVVVFVPPANVLVKLAIAAQFVEVKLHLNSGTALQPFVPVDFTVMKLLTLMNTTFTVGGAIGFVIVSVPPIPECAEQW